jgi:hypothetical protein
MQYAEGMARAIGHRLGVGVLLVMSSLAPHAGAASEPGFRGEGSVVALNARDGMIVLDYDAIPGLAATAQTEFPVAEASLLRRVRLGDRVTFTLTPESERHGMLTVTALQAVEAGPLERVGQEGAAEWPRLLPLALVLLLGVLILQAERTRRTIRRQTEQIRSVLTDQQQLARQALARAEPVEQVLLALVTRFHADIRRLSKGVLLFVEERAPERPKSNGAEALPLVVVGRGQANTYRVLQERLGASGRARVIWDRRRHERRASAGRPVAERRRRERRAPPSVTWQSLGYVLVERRSRHLTVVA